MEEKHAYLVMAHDNFPILRRLLELLDDDRNDIYIHIDKKVKFFGEEKKKLATCVNRSRVVFTKRMNIIWGTDTMIKCEILLLKTAMSYGTYEYYHLLSGVDLPLKSQNYIHDFFSKNKEKEFIQFDHRACETKNFMFRINQYHLFQKILGRRKGDWLERITYKIDKISKEIQKRCKIDRTKSGMEYYKGTNWFSITHKLAEYIVNADIQPFLYSYCADEVFLHTLVMNSPFKEQVRDYCARYIDWNRGGPYIFKDEDFDLLMKSNELFARKFDWETDKKIVEKIYDALKERRLS